MSRLNKQSVAFFSVLIIVSVLFLVLLVEPCIAVDNVKPAVPSFTVQEFAQPYDVPPSTVISVDPYTGEEKTIIYPGYTVENKTLYIVVKNQLFTPYKNDKGEMMNLYYEYCYRGHYSDGVWTFPYPEYYGQSDLEYTFIPFDGMPSRGQIDVKVRALVGTLTQRSPFPGFESGDGTYYSFEGVKGDYGVVTVSRDMILSTVWPSSTVFPTSSVDPDLSTSEPYNPPQQQTPWATYMLTVVATICIITIPIAIVMYHSRHQQQHQTRKSKGHLFNSSNVQFTKVAK